MRSSSTICTGVSAAFLVVSIAAAQKPEPSSTYPVRQVPAKELPVPTDVSPLLQRAIAQPPLPFFDAKLSTTQEWKDAIAKIDQHGAKSAREVAKLTGATVTPVTIAGVKCYQVTPIDVPAAHKDRL